MYYVRSYYNTWNLGDAIQTYALARLLPEAAAWHPQAAGPFVVNGWLGRLPLYPSHAIFAGIHISARMPEHYDTVAKATTLPVGARDPYTLASLCAHGTLACDLVGCATLTLPPYTGLRRGELHIDDGTPGCLTQIIAGDMSWPDQWKHCIERLEQLKRAAIVHTAKLHVLLPCLAFGTPVVWQRGKFEGRQRFSLVEAMGVPPGLIEHFDVNAWASRYRFFLSRALNIRLEEREPSLPA